jgi:hypothetical protein
VGLCYRGIDLCVTCDLRISNVYKNPIESKGTVKLSLSSSHSARDIWNHYDLDLQVQLNKAESKQSRPYARTPICNLVMRVQCIVLKTLKVSSFIQSSQLFSTVSRTRLVYSLLLSLYKFEASTLAGEPVFGSLRRLERTSARYEHSRTL